MDIIHPIYDRSLQRFFIPIIIHQIHKEYTQNITFLAVQENTLILLSLQFGESKCCFNEGLLKLKDFLSYKFCPFFLFLPLIFSLYVFLLLPQKVHTSNHTTSAIISPYICIRFDTDTITGIHFIRILHIHAWWIDDSIEEMKKTKFIFC